MPGMSGFELLSVIRRRFPCIRVIAMGGMFFGAKYPTESPLMPSTEGKRNQFTPELFERLPQSEWLPSDKPSTSAPLWFQRSTRPASPAN